MEYFKGLLFKLRKRFKLQRMDFVLGITISIPCRRRYKQCCQEETNKAA